MKKSIIMSLSVFILAIMLTACKTGGMMEYQNKKDNPQIQVGEFRSPSSKLLLSLPEEMEVDKEPKFEPVAEAVKSYVSAKDSNLPESGVYNVKPKDDYYKFMINVQYACFDKDKIERETGQEFNFNLDEGVAAYVKDMKARAENESNNMKDLDINVTTINIDGKDARSINYSFKNKGYPVFGKMINIVDNDTVWGISFNGDGKDNDVPKEIDKIIETIRFSK